MENQVTKGTHINNYSSIRRSWEGTMTSDDSVLAVMLTGSGRSERSTGRQRRGRSSRTVSVVSTERAKESKQGPARAP
jgi:hypothetical protein